MKISPRFLPVRRMRAPMLVLAATALLSTATMAFAGESACPRHRSRDDLRPETVLQLERARQAAARFFNVETALKEGYQDIDLFVPHMGWHFLNPNLLNGRFDPTQPQILVYQEDCDGTLRLAAVEYAVPTDLSPKAPRGFVGDDDVWFKDTGFNLWTLHAWVYDFNPEGVFTKFNQRLP